MSEINSKKFRDVSLTLYEPDYGSRLTGIIIELEKLRVKQLASPVPRRIFQQLKNIFHMLESLGSARIEGNRTTLAEFVEKVIETREGTVRDEGMREIGNIERAIDFVHEHVTKDTNFDRSFISEIHKILVDGLTPPPEGEGSRYPGKLRPINVSIKRSQHVPPDVSQLDSYFDELMEFVNTPIESQFHLLMTAAAHHRMAWIHPFDNGNGRLVRMFTYAMLIKQGFQVKTGRILNPTAIFCMDRDKYYEMLATADKGDRKSVLTWCEYVLKGLLEEIQKIDRLLDIEYMVSEILEPALRYAFDREHITGTEYVVLHTVIMSPGMYIKSKDIERTLGEESPVQRSRIIKRLKDKGMLTPITPGGRIYTIGFANNYLLRGVIQVLERNGFIPSSLNDR